LSQAAPGAVLVVDDDRALLRIMELSLEGDGFAVAVALDGRAALAALDRGRPAAIVLDYALPDVEAGALVAELRARCGADLPIVIVTATEGAAGKAARLGAAAYLRKPFDLDDLTRAVREAIQR
jgi:DNA-binding response OmpR family regulator